MRGKERGQRKRRKATERKGYFLMCMCKEKGERRGKEEKATKPKKRSSVKRIERAALKVKKERKKKKDKA